MPGLERKPILYFEDPIGVTPGYRRLFEALSHKRAQECSMYRLYRREDILVFKGNRKAPGYNVDRRVIDRLVNSIQELVERFRPSTLVLTDPSLLFLCVMDRDSDWSWATIDNLRGGVYRALGLPTIVTYPLTAWHQDVRERDIASVNYGYADEDSFKAASVYTVPQSDEDESEEIVEAEPGVFFHPIQTKVAVGKFCLRMDWDKIHRICDAHEAKR